MFRSLLLISFLAAPLNAQIHADFTVSSGGTPLGSFRVLLEHTRAPRTCANFIGLASGKRPWIDMKTGSVRTNTPYYNGLTFHRLIHDFVIQGGSPNGLGTDGPGYTILDEYGAGLDHSGQYVLSMAKSSAPNTGGSQFFITLRGTPELDNKHSVFGVVISGTDIVDSFKNSANFPTGANNKPLTPIVISSVVISGPDLAGFNLDAPALRLPHIVDTKVRITRDEAAATITSFLDRKPQTEYFTFGSPDLSAWTQLGTVLSMDGENNFQLNLESRPEPRFFLNLATADYGQIPNAPADINTGAKTIRIDLGGTFLDITPNGSGGGTWRQGSASGVISNTEWMDSAPATGVFAVASSSAFFISLGDFRTTLLEYPAPGSGIRLETWLSFHTPTSGWTESLDPNGRNRFPFQIISN